jgi:predicted metal-dependent HD superfamily phosphohydrolase
MHDPAKVAGVSAAVFARLKSRYNESHRRYHTWHHIEDMLALFDETAGAFAQPQAVALAILYHDAIYDPTAKNNESRSAELMRVELEGDIGPLVAEFAATLINATAQHAIPDDLSGKPRDDCALFLDIDMAILGAEWSVYKTYATQIREEYRHVSGILYRMGRQNILKGFLKRPSLFLSDAFARRFESRARNNIARELSELLT